VRAGLMALAAALVAAGGVTAQEPRRASVIDAAMDVKGRLDVREVALARMKGDKDLRGAINMRQSWGTADLRVTDGLDGSVCMRLYLARKPDSQQPDYLVCAGPAPDSEKLVGSVLRERSDGPPEKVATAKATRPSGRTVYLRFAQKHLGKQLVGVRFGAETVYRARGCQAPVGCRDLAPDAPGTMYLDLR
jgi:hypothetical protein